MSDIEEKPVEAVAEVVAEVPAEKPAKKAAKAAAPKDPVASAPVTVPLAAAEALEAIVDSPLYRQIRLTTLSPLMLYEPNWSFLAPKMSSLCVAMRDLCEGDTSLSSERTRLAVAALPALITASTDQEDRWNRIAHRAFAVADLCLR